MENLRKIPKVVYGLIVIALVIVAILYAMFSILGVFIGSATLILILFCLSTLISKFLIFPGSFRLWRYWWQSLLETELSTNFLAHIHELKFALELLQSSSNLLHIKKNADQLQESLEILNVLVNSYESIESSDLTPSQLSFLQKMKEVYKDLNETILIFSQKSVNLLTAMSSTQDYDWSNVTFEDFPENISLKNTISSFTVLENFVQSYSQLKFPFKLIQEGIFTNLNLLRLILSSSAHCEQYWVPSGEGQIDCVILKTEETMEKPPIMIFCNPNGGLYEYACYQNNWLEYYLALGIDLCLWNYRGYGRTKGKANSGSLKTDVQAVYDFVTKVKMYSKIGVHGESIGGVPASYLASKNDISFLFADRTFSSLEHLVTSRVKVPKQLFKFLTKWDDNTSQDFITANCYKILSCDSKDEIIPDSASLKNGISQSFNCNSLDNSSISELLEAILNINKYSKHFKLNDSSLDNYKESYILVGKESEAIEDETVTSVAFKIFKGLEIDAGGTLLIDVKSVKELEDWVRVIQTWGSFMPIGSNYLGKDKAYQKIQASIEIMGKVFRDNEFIVNNSVIGLCRQAKFLKTGLEKILKCLENFHRSNTEELTIRDEDGNEIYHAGYLVPVNCGHNGKFSDEEREMVKYHLRQVKFIS